MKFIYFFVIFFLTTTFALSQQQILILNSYHKGFEWSDEVIDGIESVFKDKDDLDINILYMDSKRIHSEDYFAKIREVYKIQLDNRHYDLIIAVDKFAYDFVLKYYHSLFKNEPILFTGQENFNKQKVYQKGLENRVYGILEKRAIDDIFSMILKLIPNLKKLYIVNDSSDNGEDTNPFVQKEIEKYKDKFQITYIRKSSLKELGKLFSIHNKNEAVFFIRFYNDKNGNFYKNNQIASMIDKSNLPVFVTDTLFFGKGAIGGKMVNIKMLGTQTGQMALNILNNQIKPLEIKTFNAYINSFDFNKAEKFKIKPDKNSSFINTPLSFFEKHRDLVDHIFMLSPFLVFLILGLIYNIYKRAKSEQKLKIIQEQESKHRQFVIQQSKLAEIGEIFSSIAHQWKNPLVEISTITQEQFYKEQGQTNSSYVDDIMIQVSYMSDTINDFQNFITPSSKKSLFDISQSIQTTMKIMEHTIKYNYIDVQINKNEDESFLVLGYKNEFMQTLLNILNNAKDQIIQARENNSIKKGKITIDIFKDSGKIILHIKDNAGGIKGQNINQIFKPYFTTKKHGHGIGLYMSKLIIEDKMGGSIEAKNCENGACFTIKLESK